MTMGPCHLYFVISDGAGNQSHSAKVDIVYPGTHTPVTEPLFTDQGMLSPASSANLSVPGIISLWTADPLRVDLVIRAFDVGNQNIPGLDFLYPPESAITSVTRVAIGSGDASTGDVLLLGSPSLATFQPIDIVTGHYHDGRDPLVVALNSLGSAPSDPYARVSDETPGVLPTPGNAMSRAPLIPARGPGSTLIGGQSSPDDTWASYWPIAGTPSTVVPPTGDDTAHRHNYDPAGLGDNVSVGRSITTLAGRNTIVGRLIAPGQNYDMGATPPASVVGEGVAIGSMQTYDPYSVSVGSQANPSGPNSGYAILTKGVSLGWNSSYFPTDLPTEVTLIGSRNNVFSTPYQTADTGMNGDTIIGHLNGAGIGHEYDIPWGITTLLAADPGYSGGTMAAPDGPTSQTQRNNDSWLYNERYATWRRLGLTQDQAAEGAASITRNTIVRRKVDASPAANNFDRTDWLNWNLAAHNVFGHFQPISNTADYENGMVLVTVPDPRVPGGLQIDGDATLGAPHHDGAGGAPGLLSFFGATSVARPVVIDDASIPAMTSLINALAQLGLILSPGTPVVSDNYDRETWTIDHAGTGQAPVGFPSDTSNIGSTGGVLVRRSETGTPSGEWSGVLYYTDMFDVYAQATVMTWDAGGDDGILIRAIPDPTTYVSSRARNYTYALLANKTGLYLRDATGAKTLLVAYSSAAVNGDILSVQAIARAITVQVNGSTRATFTLPDDLGGRMHGVALNDGTSIGAFEIMHP